MSILEKRKKTPFFFVSESKLIPLPFDSTINKMNIKTKSECVVFIHFDWYPPPLLLTTNISLYIVYHLGFHYSLSSKVTLVNVISAK